MADPNSRENRVAEHTGRHQRSQSELSFSEVFTFDYGACASPTLEPTQQPKLSLKELEKNFRPSFPLNRPGVPLSPTERSKLRFADCPRGQVPDQVVKDVFKKPDGYHSFEPIRSYEKKAGLIPGYETRRERYQLKRVVSEATIKPAAIRPATSSTVPAVARTPSPLNLAED